MSYLIHLAFDIWLTMSYLIHLVRLLAYHVIFDSLGFRLTMSYLIHLAFDLPCIFDSLGIWLLAYHVIFDSLGKAFGLPCHI